jgi:hypothetical protein
MTFQFKTFEEARNAYAMDRAMNEDLGVSFEGYSGPITYIPDSWRHNYTLAMDELISAARLMGFDTNASLVTDPNAGIPAMLTTMIDPQVYTILFAPVKMAEILGEKRKGTWLDQTAIFPVVEHVGEVETYGDDSEGGNSGVNLNFPQRQAYKFQTIIRYGQEELERAGLARINYVSELNVSAANSLNRYMNYVYAYGVQGLQNYGVLNDPHLPAAISPATKAAFPISGTNAWFYNNALNATANEIFNDIQSMFYSLVGQSAGLVDEQTKLILALSPQSETAMLATNEFNVNVKDILKKALPNLEFRTAVQYGAKTTANPEGIAAGNLVQMIAPELEGMEQGYCSFNEKLRSFPIVRGLSNFKQKQMSGSWGAIWRSTIGVVQMIGV